MTLKSKICGVSDSKTLSYLINHSCPPQFVGFIVNYSKSKRYVKLEKLKKLLKIDKKDLQFVAVLVNPNNNILEEIKDLPFDYYQLYNCGPEQVKLIKKKYKKKIITAITVENKDDIIKTFQEIKNKWGELDFVVHAIAFSDRAELSGEYINTSRENFTKSLRGKKYE